MHVACTDSCHLYKVNAAIIINYISDAILPYFLTFCDYMLAVPFGIQFYILVVFMVV